MIGFVCAIARPVTDWVNATFGISLQEILYTVASPLKGADTHFLSKAVKAALPNAVVFLAVFALFIFLDAFWFRKKRVVIAFGKKKTHHLPVRALVYLGIAALLSASVVSSYRYVDKSLQVSAYIDNYRHPTKIYEKRYVDPKKAKITAPAQKRNLIYIYMESMETTYASKAAGGAQPVNNYIPNLTQLAQQNVNFSNSDKLGGWHAGTGNGWTMGSLFSTTSGVPFTFPVDGNSMNARKRFAPGITNLGDVLEKQGYRQEFLCGSDGDFAGRKEYFKQHGNYKVFDYYSAIKKGYIPSDYYVWWGFEDSILYKIARDEVTDIASKGQPFNFTMLTVDTHHVGGYVCSQCRSDYPDQLANVVACADRQVYNFITWCEQQPWYANTTIIITGDHPRMDTQLVGKTKYYDRTVYNCVINGPASDASKTQNREFTSMDMFPTILSALGNQIKGDRLGLGTNMYSGKKTLMEKMGYKKLNAELARYSRYYVKHFD
ncbi:MAG: LTA synthase family protein [Pseudoramibacter sp.]